jgi:tRNA(Arg) A34 adenosine deaminase TadA
MTMNDERFMAQAIAEAERGKRVGNLPFGAVVVRAGLVVGRGHSQEMTSRDVTAHAEMQALKEACQRLGRDLTDSTIYTSGEPCNMCASAIFHAKISRVVIGAARSDLPHVFRQRQIGITALAEDSSYAPEIVWGVLKDEAVKLFQDVNPS